MALIDQGNEAFQQFTFPHHGGDVVGRLFKRADHSSVEKDVYSVEINGVTLPGAFHHIRDARVAGERAFAASRDGVTP